MRAVLDPNVLVSSVLSRGGAPAKVLEKWLGGEFEALVSPLLLAELGRVLAYPKIADRISSDDAESLLGLLRSEGEIVDDAIGSPGFDVADPDDVYPVALATSEQAALVTGDKGLLVLGDRLPVYSPASFLTELEEAGSGS